MSQPTFAPALSRSSGFLSAPIRAGGLAAVAALLAFVGWEAIAPAPTPSSATTPPNAAAGGAALAIATKAERQSEYGRLPLHFEPNQGQSAEAARFLARGPGYALFLTPSELVLRLRRGAAAETTEPPDPAFVGPPEPQTQPAAVLRLGFIGANPAPVIEGLEPLGGTAIIFSATIPRGGALASRTTLG